MSLECFVPMMFMVSGCIELFDPDGDGLSTKEEKALGSESTSADSDGDGLSDYLEVRELSTNPLSADTDGDGAGDGQELDLCLDPNDPSSHPYTLGWPMVSCWEKDALANGVSPPLAEVGKRIRRVDLYDRMSEVFDVYDLAGKPAVIDLYAGPLGGQDYIERWMTITPEDHLTPYMPKLWVRDAALAGDIHLIFVYKGYSLGPTQEVEAPTIEELTEVCPFEGVGCFADVSLELRQHAGVTPIQYFSSSWFLLDENMIIRSFLLEAEQAGPAAFDDLEQKLSIMLDIVPP